MGIYIPEFLSELGRDKSATELLNSVGDLIVIAFYYLLRVVEYTIKGRKNNTKQTVQFKFGRLRMFLKGQARALEKTDDQCN